VKVCSPWTALRLFTWWFVTGISSFLYRMSVRWGNLAVLSEERNRTVISTGTRTPKTRNSGYNVLTYLLTDFHASWHGRCAQRPLQCVALQFHASSNDNMVDAGNCVEEGTLAPLLHGPEKIYATGPQSLHPCIMSEVFAFGFTLNILCIYYSAVRWRSPSRYCFCWYSCLA